MATYAVRSFDVGRAKNVDTDLEEFLNDLAREGWTVVSVVTGLEVKGAGLVGNRPDSFLVVLTRTDQ